MINCILLFLLLLISMGLLKYTNSPLVIHFLNLVWLFHLQELLIITLLVSFKACVHYFSLFLKDRCISLLFRMKYIEKKFNLQLLFLPTALQALIPFRATTCYPPPWNFLFRQNNCMCNRDNAHDIAACPDE